MKRFISVVILLVVIMMGVRDGNALPSEPVAYDIVFAYSEAAHNDKGFSPNHLGVYSATTLESTPFYFDEEASWVQPLAWSPSGQYLAILKSYWSEDFDPPQDQFCLLNRDGELLTCFEEQPPTLSNSGSFQENYDITWSENEEMVYFIAERDGMRRLVEVEIATGEAKRVLFETEAILANPMEGIRPVTFMWSPDLESVVTGIGEFQPHFELVNLETQQVSDLSVIIQPAGDRGPYTAPDTGFICGNFSPINNYLTAIEYGYDQASDGVIVFSQALDVMLTIDSYPTQEQIAIDACPFWNSDESILYFYIRERNTDDQYFVGYSIETEVYEIVQWVAPNVYPASIDLSSDENHIAFIFNSAYGFWAMMMPIDGDGDDERIRLAPQWGFSAYPLWIP